MPKRTVQRPFVLPGLQICPQRKIGLISGWEDSAGVDHRDDCKDPDDARRQPDLERLVANTHRRRNLSSYTSALARGRKNTRTRFRAPTASPSTRKAKNGINIRNITATVASI